MMTLLKPVPPLWPIPCALLILIGCTPTCPAGRELKNGICHVVPPDAGSASQREDSTTEGSGHGADETTASASAGRMEAEPDSGKGGLTKAGASAAAGSSGAKSSTPASQGGAGAAGKETQNDRAPMPGGAGGLAMATDPAQAVCGNGKRDPGETCDGDCSKNCDDNDPCTDDAVASGSAADCNLVCTHADAKGCYAVESGWILGVLASESGTCPSGFAGETTLLHASPETACAATCSCKPPSSGVCAGEFTVRLKDGSTVPDYQFGNGGKCIVPLASGPVDSITAGALHYDACPTGQNCSECEPTGSSQAKVNWQTSTKFCAADNALPTCASGKRCPQPSTRVCLLSTGKRQCPAGFVDDGHDWFAGADESGSCRCEGCGVASGHDCSRAKWAFAYGSCPANNPTNLDQFYTFPASGGSGKYPVDVLVANELIGSILGDPSPGSCRAPSAQPNAKAQGTGAHTICCVQ